MTVVAGYMPTEAGQHVVDAAVREAHLRGLPLLVVNSATGAAYADRGLATPEALEDLRDRVAAEGLDVHVKQVTDTPSVADTLLAEAEKAQAALLVIGMRHRTRTGKFLLGSTAQTVLLRAPCDVLAIRLATHD
jgi:nucleotide-binding universal stress UspA family protein